jgi:hypothetical protein
MKNDNLHESYIERVITVIPYPASTPRGGAVIIKAINKEVLPAEVNASTDKGTYIAIKTYVNPLKNLAKDIKKKLYEIPNIA